MRFSEFKIDEGPLDKFYSSIFSFGKDATNPNSSTTQGTPATTTSTSGPANIQDTDFDRKLVKVANALGIEPSTLRAIIKTESRGNPRARNKIAGGLIGFTDRTARALGTTLNDILKMSALEQLDYVYKFYKMVGVQPGMDRGHIYMLTFMPAYANAPGTTVLGQKGGGKLGNTGLSKHAVWDQNPLFGKSKGKNYFTVADVKNTINSVA